MPGSVEQDSVISEVVATLCEWHQIWISLYLDNQSELFERIGNIIVTVVDGHDELVTLLSSSSQDAISREQQISELKADLVSKLDLGNRLLGLDLMLRDSNFKPIDPVELSPIKLFQLHAEAAANEAASMTSSSNGYQESTASTTGLSSAQTEINSSNCLNQSSYHLQMAVQGHQFASVSFDEIIEAYFSVVEITSSNNPIQMTHVTEKYLVQIKDDEVISGLPNTIFMNLGQVSNRDIGIYVQVYRIGRMILNDGLKTSLTKQQSSYNMSQNGSTGSINSTGKYNANGLPRSRHSTLGGYSLNQHHKRPFGAQFISLKEHTIAPNVFKRIDLTARIFVLANENEFSHFSEIYLKKNLAKTNQNLPNVQFDLTLKFLACSQESLPKVSVLNPFCLTEKCGFPDIVMPGDFKNDLYFTLETAEFENRGKTVSKNIEASISLIDKSGLPINGCIIRASNCDKDSSYKSCVFYHSNSPRWNESIKINVPLADFDSAHIRIEFRHCSTKDRDKKFLGFSFLPLSDGDGTIIPDKSHELFLYRCDPQIWDDAPTSEGMLCKYTSLPYGPYSKIHSTLNKSTSLNFTHSNRELVTVSTYLLSTKLTQNSNLLSLLKWRELIKRNSKDFEDALKKVLTLRGEEIVKFLQDILDTLFDTFTLYSTSEDDYSALIFKVLVHIFLLLDEPKYQHFRPVLDTYASAHFSATLVYRGLLVCVRRCLESSSVVERHAPIQRCFKSMKYVFQFIVQSKLLYSKATGEQNDELFLNDLRDLFKLFEHMLSNTSQKLIPIQETFLRSFPGTLEQLIKVLSPPELAKLVTSLAWSVGFRLPAPLLRAKLIFMSEVASSSLSKNRDVRLMISENFCRHLDSHMNQSEELELCHDVLETLISKTHDYHWPAIRQLHKLYVKSNPQLDDSAKLITVGEINSYPQINNALANVAKELEPFVNLMEHLLHLLDMLVQDFNSNRMMIQKYCNCLLTIFKLMGKTSFEQVMRQYKFDYVKLCNLLKSFRDLYCREWYIMQLVAFAVLEHPIDEFSKDMWRKADSSSNSRQLTSYINLIVDFITHRALQLETFSRRKQFIVLQVVCDLRIKYTSQLIRFWSGLSNSNICDLIPKSVPLFLDAALLPNEQIQNLIIPVFWDMLDAENLVKKSCRQTERCLIENLDLFMNLDRGDCKIIENFGRILNQITQEKSPDWELTGSKTINSVTGLMHLINNYRKSLENHDNKSLQMSCLVDLLGFYKCQERIDIYLKYLFKLCSIHEEFGNHVEAAFTLKLYADEIRWSQRNLSALEYFRPEEHEWRRKEMLYQKIIHLFDLAKCWEESISLCKELASFYENFLVDYERVSSTLKMLAQFLDNILTQHRPEREYFKVEFVGSDSHEFVRGKEFIYRGGEYERLAAFIQRIAAEFPDAKVLNSKGKQALAKDCSGQYLVILNVKPVPALQDHFKTGQKNVSDKIIHYYLHNRLDTFSYDVPIIKNTVAGDKTGETNIKNLWVGRHTLKVKKQLPDILPWSEVVSREFKEISPINHAIETISSMNLELTKLILDYRSVPNKQVSPLTMRLQGILEAAVNGGPAVIINAFLKRQPSDTDDPQISQQENDSLVKLRELINQQFSILEQGLRLHSNLAPPEVMPLHARLVDRLQIIKKTLLDETEQVENNYEMVYHANRGAQAEQSTSHESPISSGDQVDGHKKSVDNIYGELEDQIYSQPSESNNLLSSVRSSGTKSELSSPSSRYNTCASSSLSALAVLGNIPPPNRSRISLTPSKEIYRDYNNSSANNSVSKAARRLTYDHNRVLNPGKALVEPTASTSSLSSGYASSPSTCIAPPLPPRSSLQDKHPIVRGTAQMAVNLSPLAHNRLVSQLHFTNRSAPNNRL